MKILLISVSIVIFLTACGGGSQVPLPEQFENKEDALLSNIENFEEEFDKIIPGGPPVIPVTGSAEYTGQFGVHLAGSLETDLIGDVAFSASFRDRTVTGSAHNLLASDSVGKVHAPEGTLSIDGVINPNATLFAEMNGDVSFEVGDDEDVTAMFNLGMAGSFFIPEGGRPGAAGGPTHIIGIVFGGTDASNGIDLTVRGGSFVAEDVEATVSILE